MTWMLDSTSLVLQPEFICSLIAASVVPCNLILSTNLQLCADFLCSRSGSSCFLWFLPAEVYYRICGVFFSRVLSSCRKLQAWFTTLIVSYPKLLLWKFPVRSFHWNSQYLCLMILWVESILLNAKRHTSVVFSFQRLGVWPFRWCLSTSIFSFPTKAGNPLADALAWPKQTIEFVCARFTLSMMTTSTSFLYTVKGCLVQWYERAHST